MLSNQKDRAVTAALQRIQAEARERERLSSPVHMPDRYSPASAYYSLDSDPASTDAPEWAHAWKELKNARRLPGVDFSEECERTGEVWQYMGTVIPMQGKEPSATVVHQFRHRCARVAQPSGTIHDNHDRAYLNIDATPAFRERIRAEIADIARRHPSIDLTIPPEGDEA